MADYKVLLTFEDGTVREVDLAPYLDGEVFEPLMDVACFRRLRIDDDIETVVWENGADFSPDFLYEIGVEVVGRTSAGLV